MFSSSRYLLHEAGRRCRVARCLLPLIAPALSAQTTEWIYHKTADGAHPDGNEQQLMWLMNRARANPTAEGLFLASSGDASIKSGISYFNVNVNLMKSEFAALAAVPPAAFDRRIYQGSLAHSQDLIARNAQDHTGQSQRLTTAGFNMGSARFSVFSYSQSALNAHGALNIDWGNEANGMQAGRGHRAAIMGSYTNAGFALVPETDAGTAIGPLVFSGTYANANSSVANHFNRFLVGTVWTDGNGNNRYDPGEGVNGVTVQPSAGTWHAITGVGGGWAIPVNANTNFTLTFSGGSLAMPETRTVSVGTVSALVDLKVVPGAAPFRLAMAREASGNLLLTWTGGVAPFQVQRSTSMAAGSWQNVGAATSNRSVSVAPSGARQFYRVKDGQ